MSGWWPCECVCNLTINIAVVKNIFKIPLVGIKKRPHPFSIFRWMWASQSLNELDKQTLTAIYDFFSFLNFRLAVAPASSTSSIPKSAMHEGEKQGLLEIT